MNQLQFVDKEHPDEKVNIPLHKISSSLLSHQLNCQTMIVSQWTQNLDLIAKYLENKDIGYVRFQGDMKRDERDRAISRFKNDDEIRVLLMSLKCGGVGLVSRID